jgi:hypothetical protein
LYVHNVFFAYRTTGPGGKTAYTDFVIALWAPAALFGALPAWRVRKHVPHAWHLALGWLRSRRHRPGGFAVLPAWKPQATPGLSPDVPMACYALPPLARRNPLRLFDLIFIAMTAGCYALLAHVRQAITGGLWEDPDLVVPLMMAWAAILFVAGCVSALRTGLRHTPVLVIAATLAAGAIPLLRLWHYLLSWRRQLNYVST